MFRRQLRLLLVLLSAPLVLVSLGSRPPEVSTNQEGAEVVASWNELLYSAAEAEDGFLTLKGVRSAAMMHLAMHEVLNRIEKRYEIYVKDPIEGEGHPLAAVAQAAFRVALEQYPDREDLWEGELRRWLEPIAEGEPKQAGRSLGERVARAVLAQRAGDGWDNEADYQWHPMGPGVYAEFSEHSGTPEGFVFGAGWATARPFLVEGSDRLRSPPPPEIKSDAYTKAFREVEALGGEHSAGRTAGQSHLAMWWKDFAENSHNRLARQLVREEDLGLWETSRLFVLLQMSLYDAYVVVFENKFHYNHWRPYTAIRWAANDGNADTEPVPDWNTMHGHTYAFPSYPSAHGTACAAAMTVLAETFGERRAFTMSTQWVDRAGPFSGKVEMTPPTRQFASFEEAALECALSRVYLGIHFRYDSLAGNELGKRIGEIGLSTHFRPQAN